MKKIILSMLILVLSLSLFLGATTVYAEGNDYSKYHQIKSGIMFRSIEDGTIQSFELPEGYWVELVETNGGMVKVRYNGVLLSVDSEAFATMNVEYNYNTMTSIYYRQGQPLHAVLNEDGERVIFKTPEVSHVTDNKAGTINDVSTNLTFLNKVYNSHSELVYVVATPDGKIGYLKATGTNTPDITAIPDWVEPVSDNITNGDEGGVPDTGAGSGGTITKPTTDGEKLPAKNNIVKIILIVAISLLAVILVFLIFKPTRNKKSGRYSVDNDDDYDRDDSYSDRY